MTTLEVQVERHTSSRSRPARTPNKTRGRGRSPRSSARREIDICVGLKSDPDILVASRWPNAARASAPRRRRRYVWQGGGQSAPRESLSDRRDPGRDARDISISRGEGTQLSLLAGVPTFWEGRFNARCSPQLVAATRLPTTGDRPMRGAPLAQSRAQTRCMSLARRCCASSLGRSSFVS